MFKALSAAWFIIALCLGLYLFNQDGVWAVLAVVAFGLNAVVAVSVLRAS